MKIQLVSILTTQPPIMSPIQRLFTRLLPKTWAASMEAHSRSWMVRCSCGFSRSIWDLGGIRWKAVGEPRSYMKCPECHQRSWHKISRDPPATS